MDNFLYTCPTNEFFAGRKLFDLGVFYDNLPSKSDAQAAVSCPVPPDGTFSPPYAYLRGLQQPGKQNEHIACARVILWPRLIKSGGSYSEGIDDFHVYSCNNDGRDFPGDGPNVPGDTTLPGVNKTVLSPPDITLDPNTSPNSIYIREDNTGTLDYNVTTNDLGETTHWLTGTSEWTGSIIPSIYALDYARDDVPHAAGLFLTTVRWDYQCITAQHAKHFWVFDDEALSQCAGSCFFLEDLTAMFTPIP